MRRLVLYVAIILFGNTIASAQEQLGIRTSNYAGVNALTLNPASSITAPFKWDVNLLEFGQFFDNNYLFIENFRLLDVMDLPEKGVLRPELDKKDLPTPPDRLVVDFFRSQGSNFTYRGDILMNVMGPSLMLRLNDANVVGIYTRARGAFNARKLPGVVGYYEFTDKLYDTAFVVKPFKLGGMAWTELGLNYAHNTSTEYGNLSFGGTVKWLQGYEAGYGSMEQYMKFRQLPDNRLIGEPGRTKHGFTTPSVNGEDVQLEQKGTGFALDLGMAFTILDEYDNYRWKIGVSLLDVGAIRFNKSAQQHFVNVTDSTSLSFKEFEQFKKIEEIDSIARLFSYQTMKDPNASLQGRAFNMWLPSALSVQAEVAFTPSVFLNATLIQGIPLAKNTIRRSSVLALTPRFEQSWFEAAMPITFLDWRKMRSGLAVRLAFIWLGTEDLGSIFNKSNFDSTDFYFAIKLNPSAWNFKRDNSRQRTGLRSQKQPKVRARGNNDVKCPKF